jgi:hypothetical protein
MRTVSFSQPDVCKMLDQNFVCFHTSTVGDPTAGRSIEHRPNDPAGTCIRGNGPQNMQTLFLTPEGKIFHAVSGYASPEEFYQELTFANQLFDEMKRDSKKSKNRPEALVVESHRAMLASLGFDNDQIERGGMMIRANIQEMLQGSGMDSFGGNRPPASLSVGNQSGGIFDAMIRGQILKDHQFCMNHPLMASEDFEQDPTPLVGNGKSFFSSQSSSR